MSMELLPCPFCGGEAELYVNDARNDCCVACNICSVVTDIYSREEAIANWNRRSQPAGDADIPDYDAGLLNDWGGGNVDWWQDYIRAEIGRANDYWRSVISAAPAAPNGWHPSVKPLEWEDANEGWCTKFRAPALGGHYTIVVLDKEDGLFSVNLDIGGLAFRFILGVADEYGLRQPEKFNNLDEAKAAAQADYERRILSALSIPAAPTEGSDE